VKKKLLKELIIKSIKKTANKKNAKGYFMKNSFKLWFIALAVILICPAFTQSEDDFKVDFTRDGTGVVITGCFDSGDIIIPAKIQGYPVKEIGDEAFSGSSLRSVKIPEGVVRIGEEAFSNSRLTSVSIPSSITIIDDKAFWDCKNLVTVNFPEGLVEIGRWAFRECKSLKTVKLPNSLKKLGIAAFEDCSITALTLGTGLTEISPDAFRGNKIGSLVIPEGITVIGRYAFCGNALTTVTLPSTIRSISGGAFAANGELTTVIIPEVLTSVSFYRGGDEAAFHYCSKVLLSVRLALQKLGYNDGFN
jgi:hypothetical protein